MDKQLIEFDNAVEALGDSMLANMPEDRIKDVQQFREYFEQVADVKLRKLGLRLIDECVAFSFMFRIGVSYDKVFDKSLEIGHLREEVTKRGLRLNSGIKA
ncbi:hypothetical protein CN533_27230 [Priestia megaterium]|uniref:hypothetical protein n=1 Tax=Priestia megaterium TaxID=1404 RepID=UPI000BF5AF10|nr:hypothetical protein [Priestia megaterium]PET68284.1 hypothetical protein CN533_27230 [Priestia megaterium]PFK82637.1 hypothetical protein COJ19_25775 [Priestia megaterium]